MSEMVIDEIVEYLRTLPDHLQEEVLLFTKQLSPSLRPVGVSGSVWCVRLCFGEICRINSC